MPSILVENKVIAIMGDDLDTDGMYPNRYMSAFAEEEVAKHAFEDTRPDFCQKARNGGIVIAGRNFGCGSAREQAPSSLKGAGVTLIIARSFSRSFYRNGINVGLPLLEIENLPEDLAKEDDVLRVNVSEGTLENLTTGKKLAFDPPAEFLLNIMQAGGICNYYTQTNRYKDIENIYR
jgi:3-isopropylmalate/(R)-2-methylmalate dehydratase small subunit